METITIRINFSKNCFFIHIAKTQEFDSDCEKVRLKMEMKASSGIHR